MHLLISLGFESHGFCKVLLNLGLLCVAPLQRSLHFGHLGLIHLTTRFKLCLQKHQRRRNDKKLTMTDMMSAALFGQHKQHICDATFFIAYRTYPIQGWLEEFTQSVSGPNAM